MTFNKEITKTMIDSKMFIRPEDYYRFLFDLGIIDEDQMDNQSKDLKQVFKHFDKNNKNLLNISEFITGSVSFLKITLINIIYNTNIKICLSNFIQNKIFVPNKIEKVLDIERDNELKENQISNSYKKQNNQGQSLSTISLTTSKSMNSLKQDNAPSKNNSNLVLNYQLGNIKTVLKSNCEIYDTLD